MDLILTILIVLVILALALYAVRLAPIDGRIQNLIQIVLVVIAVIYLVQTAL